MVARHSAAVAAATLIVLGGCGRPQNGLTPGSNGTAGQPAAESVACAGAAGTVREDGAQQLVRPAGRASCQNAAFSPDGRTLLFTIFANGYDEGPAGLLTAPFDGGEVTPLFFDEGQDAVNAPGKCWSARTDRIAFSSDRSGRQSIWELEHSSGKASTLIDAPDSHVLLLEPTYSPSGREIAFQQSEPGDEEEPVGTLLVAEDGAEPRQLARISPPGIDDRQPSWSPVDDRVAFQRRRLGVDEDSGSDWDVWTIASDGSGERRVTSTGPQDTDPSWSPDGQWIVYSSDGGVDGAPPAIWAIRAAGGRPIRVTNPEPGTEDAAPSWSPDGQWIVFESHELTDQREGPGSLWRIAAPHTSSD